MPDIRIFYGKRNRTVTDKRTLIDIETMFKKWDGQNMYQHKFCCGYSKKKQMICVLHIKGGLTHGDF